MKIYRLYMKCKPKYACFSTHHQTTKFLPKSRAFVDDIFNFGPILQFFFDGVENIVEKGKNAGYQHFLVTSILSFSQNVFNRLLFHGRYNSGLWVTGFNLEKNVTYCRTRSDWMYFTFVAESLVPDWTPQKMQSGLDLYCRSLMRQH